MNLSQAALTALTPMSATVSAPAIPRVTTTRDGSPGDPLNVALVGSEASLKSAMLAAGWSPADPLTLKSCAEIAGAVLLDWPYRDAPVSDLYLFRRKQGLAFEQPVGGSPAKRHHVRFWVVPVELRKALGDEGEFPLWLGSATYDESWGLDAKERLTHHIAANVDDERDFLIESIVGAGKMATLNVVRDFHAAGTRWGLNGGGDAWHDGDGKLIVGILA